MSNLTSHLWTIVQIMSSKGRKSYQSQSIFTVVFVTFFVISSKVRWSLVKLMLSVKLLRIDYFHTENPWSDVFTQKFPIGCFHINKFVKSIKLLTKLRDISSLWTVQFLILQGMKLSFAEKSWVKWRFWSFNFGRWRWRRRSICCSIETKPVS